MNCDYPWILLFGMLLICSRYIGKLHGVLLCTTLYFLLPLFFFLEFFFYPKLTTGTIPVLAAIWRCTVLHSPILIIMASFPSLPLFSLWGTLRKCVDQDAVLICQETDRMVFRCDLLFCTESVLCCRVDSRIYIHCQSELNTEHGSISFAFAHNDNTVIYQSNEYWIRGYHHTPTTNTEYYFDTRQRYYSMIYPSGNVKHAYSNQYSIRLSMSIPGTIENTHPGNDVHQW